MCLWVHVTAYGIIFATSDGSNSQVGSGLCHIVVLVNICLHFIVAERLLSRNCDEINPNFQVLYIRANTDILELLF